MHDLACRIRRVSRLSGNFTLRSGGVSDTYFDKYRFEADPVLLLAIAHAMAPLIPSGSDALAGLEMGGIPIITMLSPKPHSVDGVMGRGDFSFPLLFSKGMRLSWRVG
jgi:orotate phosphoribosyltransferase